MCGSMVDIQSATAEIRRGEKRKKEEEEEEETTGQKYNGLPYYIGRPQKGQVSTAANKIKLCQTKRYIIDGTIQFITIILYCLLLNNA